MSGNKQLPASQRKNRNQIDNLRSVMQALIYEIEPDPNREGLYQTPNRAAKFWQEFSQPKEFTFTVFDAEGYDQMIIQRDIPFYSVCEHHLLPFFGMATMAYIPDQHIAGLSKLARLVQYSACGINNQERITQSILQNFIGFTKPLGAGVILQGRHLCMEMRGIKTPGTVTATSALFGNFYDDEVKQEFLDLAKLKFDV